MSTAMTVKEKPILFRGEMVRAILDGRKTRRRLYASAGVDPLSPEHLAKRLANGLDSALDGYCWEWKRTTNGQGYPMLRVSGRMVYAHRLAHELGNGPIPDGLHILHSCDNPICINPDHLSAGTRSQNMKECSERGRARVPSVSFAGESNAASKLTADQVMAIRSLLANGMTQKHVAERFSVSQGTISLIWLRKNWRHI